ncbi:uncharacterized protein LOC125668012 isoform X3 [Ostrea edulis]|uniref:uncharacterized protein LOC125668012 isoform X3 n=1 Tax=Ostrea edulis TaxID=37623 RepID=UPI0024AF4264|nr:uncharacterized protein LOC125668012 isoform X3 [Ostrea edulis]
MRHERIYEKLEQIEEHLSRILSFEEKLEKIVNITEFLREHGPGNIAFERTCSTKEKKFKSSRSDTNHQTYEKYRQCVPDILIVKEGVKIITDLYYKNTDSHQYLMFNSCHPSHTKRNIPFNMARRICTIVIDEDHRNTRLSELKIFLCRQKYPPKLIETVIQKAKETPTTEL